MELPINYTIASAKSKKTAREQYVKDQNNMCPFCGGSLLEKAPQEVRKKKIDWRLFPPHFLKYPIHLHHDHKTGMTIGAVHNYCNAVLWQYHGE